MVDTVPGFPFLGEVNAFGGGTEDYPTGQEFAPWLQGILNRIGARGPVVLTESDSATVDNLGALYLLNSFTLTLDAAVDLENGWFAFVKGPGTIAVTGADTIDGETSITLAATDAVQIVSNGTNAIEVLRGGGGGGGGGAVNLVPEGEWDTDATYEINDAVFYQGSSYVSRIDDNVGIPPDISPNEWMLLAEQGDAGAGAYVYIGYASDDLGTNFTTDFDPGLDYIAILATTTAVPEPIASDFAGLWKDYKGAEGEPGTDPGILLTWDTGTADADPGAGNIRANDASLASATELYVSKTNRAGSDITAFLLALADSTSDDKGGITLTESASGEQVTYRLIGVTDGAGYVTLTVAMHSGATAFVDATPISFQFNRTGNRGNDGEGAGDMLASVYDPQAKAADAFDTDNHTDGLANGVYTLSERTKLAAFEDPVNYSTTSEIAATFVASPTVRTLLVVDETTYAGLTPDPDTIYFVVADA